MVRVSVSPEMLTWACERAGYNVEYFAKSLPQLEAWIRQEKRPTFNQLEKLANITHTPFGYLFLKTPPSEILPIPDFRTVSGNSINKPSPNLLDTIYAMQRRQNCLQELLIEDGVAPLAFVSSARLSDKPDLVGQEMRKVLGLHNGWAANIRTWQDAVSELRRLIEELGIIAVINGVVGNNTHRKLNVEEFRGFALTDPYAPLIFVNGADAKSAQIFTLAHELAHIWLGKEGISGFENLLPCGTNVEKWCNQAAAEFLVPTEELSSYWKDAKRMKNPFQKLARIFKVSPIVTARRALDLEFVTRQTFFDFYKNYVEQEHRNSSTSSGGNFYNSQNTRVGKLFAIRALNAAEEGRILFKEAYHLTDLHNGHLEKYVKHLEKTNA
ncbi:MAG: ImmA/IrrE family metallo-endopeptidase [Bacteroidetes bacterium]|nr:ImmA/IrrE family metallo-endopeptidase [Bacteroidota bacterium]MCY4206002.1 ImmA/IrrE family metallo-endopeptidase [Bacteroidota bacterium]